jgi:hypothetical protein
LGHFSLVFRELGGSLPDRYWTLVQVGISHDGLDLHDPEAHSRAIFNRSSISVAGPVRGVIACMEMRGISTML